MSAQHVCVCVCTEKRDMCLHFPLCLISSFTECEPSPAATLSVIQRTCALPRQGREREDRFGWSSFAKISHRSARGQPEITERSAKTQGSSPKTCAPPRAPLSLHSVLSGHKDITSQCHTDPKPTHCYTDETHLSTSQKTNMPVVDTNIQMSSACTHSTCLSRANSSVAHLSLPLRHCSIAGCSVLICCWLQLSRCGGILPAFALSGGIDLPSQLQSQTDFYQCFRFSVTQCTDTGNAIDLFQRKKSIPQPTLQCDK